MLMTLWAINLDAAVDNATAVDRNNAISNDAVNSDAVNFNAVNNDAADLNPFDLDVIGIDAVNWYTAVNRMQSA